MLHSRKLNNKINRFHETALRTEYSGYNSSFNELLDKDGSCTIGQRNVQAISPAILSEVFKVNETMPYDLRMRKWIICQKLKDSKIRYRNYIFLVSKNLIFDTTKYKRLWLLTMLQKKKKKLQNGNSTAHVVYAKHLCNMLVLYSSTAVFPF